MSDGDNKEKLISFLANERASQKYLGKLNGKELFVTSRDKCYKIYVRKIEISSGIAPALECTQEEAGTRFLLHANHAAVSGYEKVVIKSSASDVEVISVALQHKIAARIYILSGTKQRMRLIDISEINTKLTQEVCDALLGLHAFTGCNSVSAFLGDRPKMPTSTSNNAKFGNLVHGMLMMIYSMLVKGLFVFFMVLIIMMSMMFAISYFCPITSASSHKGCVIQALATCKLSIRILRNSLEGMAEIPTPHGHGWLMNNGALTTDWMDELPAPFAVLELMTCRCTKNVK